MIQRIQTLYLLLVVALCCVALYFSLGTSILLPILIALCAIIAFIGIFLYKNRKWQMRICWANALLLLFTFGAAFGGIALKGGKISPAFYLLIVNVFLVLPAIRAIKKDEDLVKSLDRIR
jgi:4-hydroxybenzoate polyprenyltransferase